MYPLAASVRALYEAEQRQVLRITYNGVETVSGGSVSVSNAIAGNAQGLSVSIPLVQRGSGNPSPTNIRPFIGASSVAIGVSGKNMCPALVMGVSYNNNTGAQTTGSSTNASTEKFPVNFDDNPVFTLSKSVDLTVYFYAWDAAGNYIGRSTSTNFDGAMAVTPSIIDTTGTDGSGDIDHIAYMAIRLYQGTGQSISDYANAQLQFEIGDTATTYQAYSGAITSIDLGRTVYGGSLNVLTGALSVEWGFIASYNGETLPGEWLSDRDVYAADTTPTVGAQVAYRLSTPDSYTLSGAAVALAGGTNNMFVSAGDMTVSYNAVCTITDADIMEGGFEIDRYSCNGNKLEYGTAIAAELTLKLDNRDGKFDGVKFEGVEMRVEIGIADWTQTNPVINLMPCGYFTADRQPRTLNTITINALDRMTRFDTTKPLPIPWTDGDGNVMTDGRGNTIEFAAELSFPTTIANLVAQICLRCGIEMGEPVSWRTNASYVVESLPDLQQEITYRNLIQWCAGIMGTNAWMDWDGKIRFSRYNNGTPYVMTTANRFSSDLYENDITVTGVSYTNTKNETTLHGTSEYALDFTGNYLIPENSASVLGNLYTNLRNFTYRPFSATVKNAPYMWPMDTVVFTDKNGVNHNCVLTNVNFGLNGTTVLEGRGETTETNSTTAPSAMTTQQGFVIEKAVEKTLDNVDKSMTQEAIFNRLTNNGTTQALILYEGNLYLNATYINTGTLVADRIKGGTLKLGGSANGNGVLQILDGNGAVIGSWDKDGISATKGTFAGSLSAATGTFAGTLQAATGTFAGELSAATGTFAGSLSAASGTFKGELQAATGTFKGELSAATGTFAGTLSANCITSGTLSADRISGGTLKLGGNGNTFGALQIVDASGNVIGTWDRNGINATSGTFSGALNAATGTFAGTLSAACITSGTLSADRIAANSISVSKLTGSISGGNNWLIDLTNGTMTIGNISADSITSGSLSSSMITSGPFHVSGNNIVIDAAGTIELNGDISINSYQSRDATIIIDGETYNFHNGILVQNLT